MSLLLIVAVLCLFLQESQVSIDCVIASKHHRVVLGQKGHHVQEITRTHNVSIKFPERNTEGRYSDLLELKSFVVIQQASECFQHVEG